MNHFKSNVRFYSSQRIRIAYLVVSVRTPPNLTQFSKKSPPCSYVFTIDKETGGIYHGGFPNIDIFPNETVFTDFLKSVYTEIFDFEDLGSHLIGATVSNNQLIIACVKEKEEVAKIFNQPIYKITNVHYKNIPLWNKIQPSNSILLNFNICDNHFFCPTLDISATFPYPKNAISNGAFCWNKRFLIPFEENHALNVCIIVLQGAVFSLYKDYSTEFNIFYVIKRSAMFPGTRYNARGLNSPVDPANECECDLIFYENNTYYAQSWRRGSPPVLWETEIKNLLMANHVVKENANNDTPMYFLDSIIQRFEAEKVCVISLLQSNNQEKKIDEAYAEGVETLSNVFPHVTMKYTNFDINALLKEKGIDRMVRNFYKVINEDIIKSNFTIVDSKTGQFHISETDKSQKRQRTVFRFNCADSLDRTNVATFFYSLALTAKFINICGCTKFKKKGVEGEIKLTDPIKSLNQEIIDFLGESFIDSGNIISLMYTNTDAIKTHIIRHFMTPTKDGAKDSDKVVSVVRRFQNCVLDGSRQAIIEEWTSNNVKNSKFMLDEQHISLLSRSIYEKTSITHQILESPIQQFTLIPKGDNIVIAMFPEPFLLCSISIFIVPNLLSSLLNITLTVDSDSNTHALFFHNIPLPYFSEYRKVSPTDTLLDQNGNEIKGVWVTYDFRKLAKLSNYFPVEPLCLQPTSFVSIRFAAFCKKINLGNIRFVVKRPNNPRKCYFITGNPPVVNGKKCTENIAEIYKNLEYRQQTLSELRSIEMTRIEHGINDYFRNNYIVRLKRNPWVYDLRSYSLRRNKDMSCINCGEKASDFDKTPPFFIPDSQYPITCVKTDVLDESNKKSAIVLCKDCKPVFDDQMQVQLYFLKNVNNNALVDVNEYVGYIAPSFSKYESKPFELNHLANVFLSTFKNADEKKLRKLLTGCDAKIEILEGTEPQRLILCYPVGVSMSTLLITFTKPVKASSFNISMSIYDDAKLNHATLTEVDENAPDAINETNNGNDNAHKDIDTDEYQSDSGIFYLDDNDNHNHNIETNTNDNNNPVTTIIDSNIPKTKFKFKISNIPQCIHSIRLTFEKNPTSSTPTTNFTDNATKPRSKPKNGSNTDCDDDSDTKGDSENEQDNNSTSENKILLSSLYITGTFKYISSWQSNNQSSPKLLQKEKDDDQDGSSVDKSKKKKKKKHEKGELPRFSETKCTEWKSTFRTQEFKYTKPMISGFAVKCSQSKESRAHALILGFYKDSKYVAHEPIVIPMTSKSEEVMYFPISSRPSDFNTIVVFYLDRIGTVEPYKFMFFD